MARSPSILMTRRRVDRLMLSLTILVVIASGTTSLITQNLLHLPHIAIPILLWLNLRRKIPSDGTPCATIEGNFHVILLLVWLLLCLSVAMLMLALDYLIMGHKIRDPLQLYHWVAFVTHFAIMLTGVALIERYKKRVTMRIADAQTDVALETSDLDDPRDFAPRDTDWTR